MDRNGDDWFIYGEKNWLGMVKKSTVQLIWLNSTSAVYDPDKYYYNYVGPSLSWTSLYSFFAFKYDTYRAHAIMHPVECYELYYQNNKDPELESKGYEAFGIMVDGKDIFELHPTEDFDYSTNMDKVFVADNNKVNVKNFYSVIMHSFLHGKGPENFYFDKSSEVSKSMAKSALVKKALEYYYDNSEANKDNADKLKSGKFTYIDITELELPGMILRSRGKGTRATPEHLIGSAEVRIHESLDGKKLFITIFNTTSLGSGTLGAPKLPKPGTVNEQPFTNVSQTIELEIDAPVR